MVGMNMAVKKQRPKKTEEKSRMRQTMCFVLMPFSVDFDVLYENAIRPAVETMQWLLCLRADEIYGPHPIMADIWKSINDASILIADLTGRNSNVLYELGLAHARQKPVVMIAQDISDVPFDLRAIRCLIYTNNRTGRAVLEEQLKRTLRELALDIRRKQGAKLQEYVVLPPSSKQTSPKNKLVELSPNPLQEPWSIISSLRQRSDQLKVKGRKHKANQSEIETVLALIH
jgi:hypothetical protein